MNITLAVLLALVAAAPMAVAQNISTANATKRLARIEAAEPSAFETRAAALRYAGLARLTTRSWTRRARLSGMLPKLTLTASDSRGDDEDHSRLSTGSERIDLRRDRALFFQARASWSLDKLMFHSAEIRAIQTGQRLHQQRLALAARITALYFRRRQLQMQLLFRQPGPPMDDLARRIEIEELTEQIDALTGGFFSSVRR